MKRITILTVFLFLCIPFRTLAQNIVSNKTIDFIDTWITSRFPETDPQEIRYYILNGIPVELGDISAIAVKQIKSIDYIPRDKLSEVFDRSRSVVLIRTKKYKRRSRTRKSNE